GQVPEQFVPGHPIAGSEQSGVEASTADLYVDHRVILTPLATTRPDALDTIRAMWEVTGAEVVDMDVAEHDVVLAATSHLPHVLAYGLVDALAQSGSAQAIFRFAAGGFRDFTRIASSDPVMWHDIVRANRSAVLDSLDTFTEHLAEMRQAIESDDSDAILATFERAKKARDEQFLTQYQVKGTK
uniref:prephenate dehydrogenase/arogenate dehydrogenase family protein n=1 Tax=Litorivivens sp. TaxID=2020868 RepID=UPI00356AA65D